MADKVRLTDKKFKEVFNFVDKYVDKDAAKAFDKAYKEGREIEWLNKFWPQLEEYTPWTNTYSSIEDLTASPEKQLEQIYNKNPDYDKISEARMKNILDNNDVTEEQLKSYYAYRKAQSDAVSKINEDRYKDKSNEYAQIQRSKDDSWYNHPLANEYAREAYIKGNPNEALAHEIAGVVAGAADFAPWLGIIPIPALGPIIRTGQKAFAGKDVLTTGTLADFAGAVIPDFAEKPARFLYNSSKEVIERFGRKFGDTKIGKAIEARVNAADAAKSQAIAKSDIEVMKTNLDNLTDKQLLELYDKANNPKLKSAIEEYFKARGQVANAQMVKESLPVQRSKAATDLANEGIDEAYKSVDKANAEFIKTSAKEAPTTELRAGIQKQEPFVDDNLVAYYKDTPLSTLSEYEASKVTPDKFASSIYTIMQYGGRKAARAGIGGRLGQWNTFNPEPADKSEQLVKDVISMYSNKWSPMELPPEYHTNPLIRDAYDKWYNDIANRQFYEAEWTSPKTHRILKGDR